MAEPLTQGRIDEPDEQREWVREAVAMALYVGLSLLAVMIALPASDVSEGIAGTVLLTALGLLLAHQLAFRLSTRLVNRGLLDTAGQRLLAAQLAGGVAVAFLAAVPVFLLGPDPGITVSESLLLAFVAATGYVAARHAGRTPIRSLAYVALVIVVAVLILVLKSLTGH